MNDNSPVSVGWVHLPDAVRFRPAGMNIAAWPASIHEDELMRALDDQKLVVQSQAGDERAFRELVRRYQQKVYGVALGMLHSPDDAMDVTQEAFIRVHKYLDRFKGNSSFYTWAYRITVNLCIDHLRKQKRAPAVEFDDALDHDDTAGGEIVPSTLGMNPARNLDRRELGQKLQEALATLSPAHRAVILMREVEGMSYKEMAEAQEISIGTVMSRLFHARRRMQAAMIALLGAEAMPGAKAASAGGDEGDGR